MTHYPKITKEKCTLEDFIDNCKTLLEERKENKKKPLKCLENAVNGITDGCQGDKLYEINRKIIDLSEPLLTEEAVEELDEIYDAPLDPEGRGVKNVYGIITKHGMSRLQDSTTFGNLFGMYERIRKKEIENAKNI